MYALINHAICECYTKPNYLIGLTSRTFSYITELQPASTYVVVFYRQVCVDFTIRLFMWRSRLLASRLCNFRICLSDFSPQYQYSHGDKYLCFNLVLDIFVSFYVRNRSQATAIKLCGRTAIDRARICTLHDCFSWGRAHQSMVIASTYSATCHIL